MKIFLEAKNLSANRNRQHLKVAEVHYLLDRHKKIQKRRFLRKLTDFLVFPESYLITFPAPILSSLIVNFLHFLENKSESIVLKTLPLKNGNHHLLMISTPNVPYLVETLLVLQQNYADIFTFLAHPVLSIKRRNREIIYLDNDVEGDDSELFILIRLENIDVHVAQTIQSQSQVLLTEAYQACQAFPYIRNQLEKLKSVDNLKEYQSFIKLLQGDAFIPLINQKIDEDSLFEINNTSVEYSGLNLSRCQAAFGSKIKNPIAKFVKPLLSRDTDVIVQTLPIPSPVISSEPLVYIGFRENCINKAWIEHVFIGVFNNLELNTPSLYISELHNKIETTLINSNLSPGSYDYARLQEIFSLFPKLELFFLAETQLYIIAKSLCRYLYQPDSLKVLFLASPSPFRFSLLVIAPHQFAVKDIEAKFIRILNKELSCSVEISRIVNAGGNYSALQLLLIPTADELHLDISNLEKILNRRSRPWETSFKLLLEKVFGKPEGSFLWRKYHGSFSSEYRSMFPPRCAIKDIMKIEKLSETTKKCVNLIAPCRQLENFRLHFYSEEEFFLDEYIPVLENLHLRLIDQVQFSVNTEGRHVYIKSFAVSPSSSQSRPLHQLKPLILDIIQAILDQRVDNDGLNQLLILAGMSWKEIDVLRAYRNYFLQLNFHSTVSSFHRALVNNPQLAKSLYDYFEVRFRPSMEWQDPMLREEQGLFPIRLKILKGMETVADLNDDKILRTLFNLIDSTVRSNFHVRRNHDDYFISFKINSLGVIDMPAPKPAYEIYVHGADMEGIHIRGGKISRGGIRWSDRPDDFRTEILGLMQTQMSKNALIVPTGAKGGFVVRNLKENESFQEAGKKAYIRLMRGLLDLTDNYIEDHVINLPGIIQYDDNDPYLVVAADKGTAKFPDVANAVAAEYSFWMGDAFASGGAQGYNHKALAVTARGAWESVKRHFREIGKDIQTEEFSVVGVGSMDGDVFGNGMLLSPFIKLRAAISGQHIFIDPDPEPQLSFQERKRLFDLPGSSWEDYDSSLISNGGGVFSRNSKDIPVSEQLQQWLNVRYKVLDGESLIRYLLTTSVDLLWLGGIGTYVKSSMEKQEDVGDRNNDNVRVDANMLRAKVVGEGANLGFTQKARVEFALAGGRINTDAIDNSAGVDTSDHEVNLKILLTLLHKKSLVENYQQLFDSLTVQVCDSVLADNYFQTLCLSLEQIRCQERPELFLDLAERMQSAGFLDAVVDSFPKNKQVMAREGIKLSRPELAILMAAGKRWFREKIQEQPEFLTDASYDDYLLSYFPVSLVEKFAGEVPLHPLASVIKATYISNLIINQAGCGFLKFALDANQSEFADLVGTYLSFDKILDADSLRKAVFELDNKISTDNQYRILLDLEAILADFCFWSVSNNAALKPNLATITTYRGYLLEMNAQEIEQVQPDSKLLDELPHELATRIQFVNQNKDFPAIVKISVDNGVAIDLVLSCYQETAKVLYLELIERQLRQIPSHDLWERKVLVDLRRDFKYLQGQLVVGVLKSGAEADAYFEDAGIKAAMQRYQQCYYQASSTYSLMPYVVLHKELQLMLENTKMAHLLKSRMKN